MKKFNISLLTDISKLFSSPDISEIFLKKRSIMLRYNVYDGMIMSMRLDFPFKYFEIMFGFAVKNKINIKIY